MDSLGHGENFYNTDFDFKILYSQAMASFVFSNATNYSWTPNYGYQLILHNVGMTLQFAF